MDVRVIKDYDGVPEGSVIQDVTLEDGVYSGLLCSYGSFMVSVPAHVCCKCDLEAEHAALREQIRDYLLHTPQTPLNDAHHST